MKKGGGLGAFFLVLLNEVLSLARLLCVWFARGSLCLFHLTTLQANEVARAHVRALGGNALIGYRLNPRESTGNRLGNQAYHMVSVSGDVVHMTRHPVDAPHAGMVCLSSRTGAFEARHSQQVEASLPPRYQRR